MQRMRFLENHQQFKAIPVQFNLFTEKFRKKKKKKHLEQLFQCSSVQNHSGFVLIQAHVLSLEIISLLLASSLTLLVMY